jgi:hypothetical protein
MALHLLHVKSNRISNLHMSRYLVSYLHLIISYLYLISYLHPRYSEKVRGKLT